MQTKTVQENSLTIIGIHIETTNQQEMDPATAQLGKTWERFFNQDVSNQIPNITNNGHIYACYTNYETDRTGKYTFVLGHAVTSAEAIPENMTLLTIPAQSYELWQAKGEMPQTLIKEWHAIWGHYDQATSTKRAYSTDFEVHNPNKPEEVSIYIAI